MENITIQKAGLNDILDLQKLGRETFFETFADTNSSENMQKYLDESFDTAKLNSEVSNPNSQFFIATLEDQIIGYLKINTLDAQTESKSDEYLEIERIYVLKAFHGKKVGQLLYEQALSIATNGGFKSVWLGVWEKNYRAQKFYEKNGFTVFDKHVFHLGDDIQTDLMMIKSID